MSISEKDFEKVIFFIEKNTGIFLPDTNYRLVKSFLLDRFTSLKMNTDSYLEYIKENRDEYGEFLDSVTVSETYLFREEKHFKVMDSLILPEYVKKQTNRFKCWSAACSYGAEPVSIAVLAEKHFGSKNLNYSVYASDINPHALELCKRGEFTKNSFREDGESFHYLLDPHLKKAGSKWILKDSIKSRISCYDINLINNEISKLPDNIDLVLLRNLLIYMKKNTRIDIISNIVKKMSEGGYLFLSSSEIPLASHDELRLVDKMGTFFFQKKAKEERESR